MTTITNEPSPPLGLLLRPFAFFCAGVYVFFTAFAMEVYVLLPVAAACFVFTVLPARRLLRHR